MSRKCAKQSTGWDRSAGTSKSLQGIVTPKAPQNRYQKPPVKVKKAAPPEPVQAPVVEETPKQNTPGMFRRWFSRFLPKQKKSPGHTGPEVI